MHTTATEDAPDTWAAVGEFSPDRIADNYLIMQFVSVFHQPCVAETLHMRTVEAAAQVVDRLLEDQLPAKTPPNTQFRTTGNQNCVPGCKAQFGW